MNDKVNDDMPRDKNVLVVNVPFTFVDKPLCPLELVCIDTLKIIALLKNKGNHVDFIDTRSKQKFLWKKRKVGIEGKVEMQMHMMTKTQNYINDKLRSFEKPNEIWVLCQFPFAPYTFDNEVIELIIGICKDVYPDVKIKLGGDFFRMFPEFSKDINRDYELLQDFGGYDELEPDFSVIEDWYYGLFQITKGCNNKCSFCIASLDEPKSLSIDFTINYMKKFYDMYKPDVFWNWDPNVLLFPKHFEDFLDKYIESGMDSKLRFALGFQPDLLNKKIIEKLISANADLITIPFETGSTESKLKIGKPYTIISSIKALQIFNDLKANIRRVQSSFIIGYPHDDFTSIFRIYLSILRMNAQPLPFPLYVFPNTMEHKRSESNINSKIFSELHGQLWPCIKSDDVEKYQNLLKFLRLGSIDEAKNHISLLSDDLKDIFYQELKNVDRFVRLCLDAEKDSLSELKRVEEELLNFHDEEKILFIVANPKPLEKSSSKQLGEYFKQKYLMMNPSTSFINLDLYKEDIQFIDADYIAAIYGKVEGLSDKAKKLIGKAENYISDLRTVDKIVVVCPMWTLSIPAILKAYLEMVASRLFYYHKERFRQRRVLCLFSRDGVYPESGNSRYINVQEKSLLAAFGFMGIGNDITFICAEGMMQEQRREESIKNAKIKIDEFVYRF